MTTITFLVTMNVDDVSMVQQIAEDIDNDLMDSGYDVTEVKPWSRPSLGMTPAEPDQFGIGPTAPPPPTLF
jgi:hypothetical protein